MSLSAATYGTGSFGQTYRVIAASSTMPGDPSQNVALTFNMGCDPSLQNYLTVKLWGSDTTVGVVYLYDPIRGHEMTPQTIPCAISRSRPCTHSATSSNLP